jgi:radial spoke head protein 9
MFSTTGDFTLGQMPEISAEWAKMSAAITMPFRGEPSLPLMADGSEGEADPEAEPAGEDEAEKPPPERFREMHRLAFAVSQIDHDAAALPRGAFVVDASHTVGKNKSYEGLSYEAAGKLASYYHFRPPESARAMASLAKPGIVRPGDFMDPCAEDQPNGVWSVCYDPSNTVSILRNFYWPGYFFYHIIGTPEYGGVYFGDGLPNVDIAFML